jgi:basic membrane protein A and related proteins
MHRRCRGKPLRRLSLAANPEQAVRQWSFAGAVALVVLAAASLHTDAAARLKIGFVYLGPIGDLGWTYQHEVGRRAVVAAFGERVETTYLENVPEGPDAERFIEQLARTGHQLIFAASFGYMDPVIKVAAKYPNVHFEHATGYKRAANVSTYATRSYEGNYIQGMIAAHMSKTGVLGYISSFPIPEVISGLNATMLGAQTVNPDIKIKIIWVNTWFDPPREADAAKALADQGADVLMAYADSPATLQVAAQRGILAFGQSSDMINFGPRTQLTSTIDNWVPYYTGRARDELDGAWTSRDTWGGLASGMVLMAPYTNMPEDVKKHAAEIEAALKAGSLHPFTCPMLDQQGAAIECKDGGHLSDAQIRSMNFYVKGIDDRLPAK